jgi:transposase
VSGKGSKIHIIMGKEDAVCVQVTGAQVHDSKVAYEMVSLLNTHVIDRFVGDKGYDADKIRSWLAKAGIVPEIPSKRNRVMKPKFDKIVYKWRHRIENLFAKIKENGRLAMRVDKLDLTFMGFIALALIKLEVC